MPALLEVVVDQCPGSVAKNNRFDTAARVGQFEIDSLSPRLAFVPGCAHLDAFGCWPVVAHVRDERSIPSPDYGGLYAALADHRTACVPGLAVIIRYADQREIESIGVQR